MKRIIKRDLGSDLREINIFIGLTLIIFFVAVGFPTLLNTSPSYGYEGVEWTPVTTMYQEAYAYQEEMEKLAFVNFNPFVTSAFLVMPTTLDNPPPDPTQYFELKYGQPISLESGFVETVKESGLVETVKELFTAPQNNLLNYNNFEILPKAFGGAPPPLPDQVVNLTLSHDNINTEIDLTWNASANADDYVVQRLSTERQLLKTNGLGVASNFVHSITSTNPIRGDGSGFGTFDIPTQTEMRVARFTNNPSGGQVVYGYWTNVTIGVVDQIEPHVQGEVNQTGFMVSAGTRLALDCSRMQTSVEQDGWTQRPTGFWFDGNCQVEQRYLGTQLKNLTVADTAGLGIAGVFRKDFTEGNIVATRPSAFEGSGFRFQDSTSTWFAVSGGTEVKTQVMDQSFINITTTTNNFFSDNTTNNYNTYFYRIIPKNISGEGGSSSLVNGTLSLPPLRVPDLNGTDNITNVVLVWEEAPIKKSRELSEDPVQGYIIQRAIGGNETTIYDGFNHDVEEFFLDGTGLNTINNPKPSSDRTHAGQQLNITQAVNITRIVVKLGCGGCGNFNVEPDLSGSIHFANGTQITRSIPPSSSGVSFIHCNCNHVPLTIIRRFLTKSILEW